jgi:hypothetical protein
LSVTSPSLIGGLLHSSGYFCSPPLVGLPALNALLGKSELTHQPQSLILPGMIVEQYPEIQRLSPERKLALAAELFEDATDCRSEQPDPDIIRLLDERLAEYEKNPSSGSPWSEVKLRILGSRDA